ncbi:MAG: aminopeptidase P family protein [Acidobacteria bacterium]|nr:aminopeptidase P family protein [Acidobacteriota bacterium]
MRRHSLLVTVLCLVYASFAAGVHPAQARTWPQRAAAPGEPAELRVLTHREQAPLVKSWIEKRFTTILPALMRREGIDMWIIVSREYNDDPVFRSMAPLTTYSSRRRTILVFHDRGADRGVDRLSIGRFDYEGLYTLVRTPNDGQWDGLRKLVEERKPKVIGINTSPAWNHADGLTANEKDTLARALGPEYASRLKSAEMLAVGWLEAKLPEELDAYRHVMKIAHRIIAEAFSNQVIVPGVTTLDEVAWWMRQRVANLGLGQWFHPTITIWRKGGIPDSVPADRRVIQRGDMLHCDFGLVYLGFSTDTQHNAYVLRPGETDAPAGLKAGLAAANRLQDITRAHAKLGGTGNQALLAALRQARQEGLQPSIYCHPVGYHGHGAGPPIGMIDYQEGVPVRGDYVFRPDTWHSIELNVTYAVKEWDNQPVRFALEEDAALLDAGWDWIDGRQTEFYLIQ